MTASLHVNGEEVVVTQGVGWKLWWEMELKKERVEEERGGKFGFMVQLAPRVVIYICNKPSWGTSQSGGG
jgi:hypothetical protein